MTMQVRTCIVIILYELHKSNTKIEQPGNLTFLKRLGTRRHATFAEPIAIALSFIGLGQDNTKT